MPAAHPKPLPLAPHLPLTDNVKRADRAGNHRLSPLTQALDLRDVAYANATDPNTPPHIKAALMRAFVDLLDLCMALRGQGKPKPVEARNATPKRKANGATVVYPAPSAASAPSVVNETNKPAA